MSKKNNKVLVLLSGGLDSTALLHLVEQELCAGDIYSLSFIYGQRHIKELECAEQQALLAGCKEHKVINLDFMGDFLKETSALIQGGEEVPNLQQLDSETLKQPPTYVPNRNMLLLSLAAAYAESQGISDIYYGAQEQDDYGYWDCTVEFLENINSTLSLNRKNPVKVHAPLINNSKADNVLLGKRLGIDFSKTWSCYKGGEKACGTCPTCVDRLNAFNACSIIDPLVYE